LGYNVTSVLAGVSVGGIAIALAAKDTVSNLFGSIMIFTDKPFEVGDWIKTGSTEGIVEEIGLRSTKVRTFQDTLISIPNSHIGAAAVENVSRFQARRVYVNLGIRYDTELKKIEPAIEGIRKILDEHGDVRPGHYRVPGRAPGDHPQDHGPVRRARDPVRVPDPDRRPRSPRGGARARRGPQRGLIGAPSVGPSEAAL
ncbi:MAG: mechanosensitive ion channel family protein, partial [Planctomycetota bacterium]